MVALTRYPSEEIVAARAWSDTITAGLDEAWFQRLRDRAAD
ncbi:hypothetical protein [Nocardia sp. NBC_00403]